MNVRETLKKLHKKFPLMSLDELFEILDCYVEEIKEVDLTKTISTWEPPGKIWYSTDKVTCSEKGSDVYSLTTNKNANAKLTYYDGEGSTQLVAEH